MKDGHARIVEELSRERPAFAAAYAQQAARTRLIVPIVEARRARGWSQRDLARASGVAQPVITRFEVGDTDPKVSTLARLGHALGLQVTFQPERDAS
jgi:ribosome-binding protein aMBF1 (putative translation factor)